MQNSPLTSSIAALVLAAAASGTLAAEPGDAAVRSYLGQPLSADIELTDLSPQDLVDLQARMSRPDVFEGANVKMHPALAGATLSIVRRDGRRVLHVATTAPVQAEVVHLFFQLSSGGRDRTRSVTLWLTPDPNPPAPVKAAPVVAAASAPVKSASEPKLLAVALPGKDATAGERQLMNNVEKAFAARGPKVASRAPHAGAPAVNAQSRTPRARTPDERTMAQASRADAQAEKGKRPILTAEMIRKAAMAHSSSAEDFKRGSRVEKPAIAAVEKESAAEPAEKSAARTAAKPGGLKLVSREELAEAARATRESIEQGEGKTGPKKGPAGAGQAGHAASLAAADTAGPPKAAAAGKPEVPKAPATAVAGTPKQDDPAMLNELAELEAKLNRLQAMVGEGGMPGAAAGAKPATAAIPEVASASTKAAAPEPAKAPAAEGAKALAATHAPGTSTAPSTAHAPEVAKGAVPGTAGEATDTAPAGQSHAAIATAAMATAPAPSDAATDAAGHAAGPQHAPAPAAEAAKPTPREAAKAAEPPKEPEKKEIKISRPKILTFLFAASLVLLAIFGVIVHFIRKAKNKRSPVVRQNWTRDEDDAPRVEPTASAAAAPSADDLPKAA